MTVKDVSEDDGDGALEENRKEVIDINARTLIIQYDQHYVDQQPGRRGQGPDE